MAVATERLVEVGREVMELEERTAEEMAMPMEMEMEMDGNVADAVEDEAATMSAPLAQTRMRLPDLHQLLEKPF